MQLRAAMPRDANIASRRGRRVTCGVRLCRGTRPHSGFAPSKAKSLSTFDHIPEQLYSPLIFDARQIPAYGFAEYWSTQIMILQDCYTITPHGQARKHLQLWKLDFSIGTGPADVAATGKDRLQGRKIMSCCVPSSRVEGVAVAWDVDHGQAQKAFRSAAKGPCPLTSRAVPWRHLRGCFRPVGQHSPSRGTAQGTGMGLRSSRFSSASATDPPPASPRASHFTTLCLYC